MGMLNRRNAALGWIVWRVAKRWMRRKAKAAVPGTVEGSKRPNRAALLALVASVGGALLWWRSRDGGDDGGPDAHS